MSEWPTQIPPTKIRVFIDLHWHPPQVICPSPFRKSVCFILDEHTQTRTHRHTHTQKHTTTTTVHIPNRTPGYSLYQKWSKIPSNGFPRATGMASQRWRGTSATDRPCPPLDCRLRIDGRLRRPGEASSTPASSHNKTSFGTVSWLIQALKHS